MLAAILANQVRLGGDTGGDPVWITPDHVKRKRDADKLRRERKLQDFLEETYNRIHGIEPEIVEKVVRPYITRTVDKTAEVPRIQPAIDYAAMARADEARKRMLELYQEYLEEEDIAALLLLVD